ncbi:hypothetical protein PHYSODRAFT_476212 [Phytophthora sojae]|uniref:Uncharacterized protein n=1 Tax=Phytophthora sojae (strain P6497) TaxID=1094619 RepID=G4YDZ7_PHYSP|nr:hypothetical protein PHYSODRAFT_476212 [Phytophthora sojae]EGZ29015.1 hypothetical protein PHYSODRAFT_476212 [Phytophthora sojae]|eukprot:XP_009516290.1 hypothetical protein PHYSODRAFT_476212 [Phytophthora sojae]
MDLALNIVDILRQIYELRDAIRRQRHVNRRTYLRMMEIYVELQSSGGIQTNATLARTATLDKFSAAVTKFLLYLQKYHDMHRVVRLFKFTTMEEQRLRIVDEIDQLYRMLNLATVVAVLDGAAAASSNAARLFAKLEDMHGDIKLTHDQIHAALLADKQQVVVARKRILTDQEPTASRRVLVRQGPILTKYAHEIGDDPTLDDDEMEEKSPVQAEKVAVKKREVKRSVVCDEEEEKLPPVDTKAQVEVSTADLLGADDTTAQQKEDLVLDLLRKCVTNSNRVQVYKIKGIPVLTNLVRHGETFLTQLYALHCLSWFTFSFSKLRESDFMELNNCVREPSHEERLSLLHDLQSDDDEVKERAALRCSCVATRVAGDALRQVGVLPLLIGLLKDGTDNQKLWAAEALVTLASDDDENCVAITRGGAIPPLVLLLRSGTDMHKQEAAYALGNLAANNEVNRAKIAREGAIPPMVEFVKSVTDAQNQWAVYALGFLSLNNEENRVLISQEGAIRPLVKLLRVGTRAQKQWAAYTLGNLAHNDANRAEITREGAITPLIQLLRTGTAMQKQRAAFALGNLACDNDTVTTDFDEAILPLVDLVRMGSDTQKEDAAYTLGNLAANNGARRAEIGRKGAIAPLVKLLKTGDGEQKQWAAFALRCLAYDNDLNRVAVVDEGAIEPLAAMMEEGTEEQKEEAAHALEHLVVKDVEAANTFIPDRVMTSLRGYWSADAISQNANVAAAAALNTFGTVREGVLPLFRKLVKSDADTENTSQSTTREDPKAETKGSSWAGAW